MYLMFVLGKFFYLLHKKTYIRSINYMGGSSRHPVCRGALDFLSDISRVQVLLPMKATIKLQN